MLYKSGTLRSTTVKALTTPPPLVFILNIKMMYLMNKLIVIAGTFCFLLASCKNESLSGSATAGLTRHGDTVVVAAQSVIHSGIKLQRVEWRDFCADFHTTGIVRAIAGQMAEIAPLFDGRITRSFVGLGEKVSAGAPLFELYSAEFSEAVKTYFQSLQAKEMKRLNLQRRQDLVKNGVGAVKELEEAATDYELSLREYENASAALKILHIDPEEIRMGEALNIVSPIAGEVVQSSLVVGQYVKSDAGAPLAVVADLDRVWVAAQVKENFIHSVRKDDRVEVRTDADYAHPVAGEVSYISEWVDEETRSIQVLVTCNNKDRRLKPGMFAEVHFTGAPRQSILIPSTALLQDEAEAYVFVRESEGRYLKRPVKAVTAGRLETLIADGLEAGEVIVTEGSIYLMGN